MSAAAIKTTPFPTPVLPTFQTRKEIGGVQTDVLVQSFIDRFVVYITQIGKVGCLIQATTPSSSSIAALSSQDLYDPIPDAKQEVTVPSTLTRLFGTPPSGSETLYDLYVSQIVDVIRTQSRNKEDSRPVVVGLGLKMLSRDDDDDDDDVSSQERDRLVGILGMVKECTLW